MARRWVGGTLCELDGEETPATLAGAVATVATLVLDGAALAPHDWVRITDSGGTAALARVSAVDVATLALTLSPAPSGLTAPLRLGRVASYANQPDLPAPELTAQPNPATPRALALADGTTYLAYLDVWQRTVTALEAPEIREKALGGPDTTTRSRTVWQLRLLPLSGAPATLDCSSDLSAWTSGLAAPTGTMAARAEPDSSTADLCTPTPAGGFTGLENQLYRVQVHDLTSDGRPLIVWSRDNGLVVTAWSGTSGNDLAVAGIGPDAVLGFAGDQWVELLDDASELHGTPGTLVKLLKAEGSTLVVDPATVIPSGASIDHDDFGGGHAKVRRWDSDGAVTVTFGTWISLEHGVQVRFSQGTYRQGDFWLVPARTAVADVDWPRDPRQPDPRPLQRPPHGVEHTSGPLALVRAAGGQVSVIDCRDLFPSLTTLSASDVAFDDTICAMPGVDTVQEALDQLCRSNYDLDSGRLVARIDPIAGKEVGPKDKLGTGTGTGAATDVAFSPDGKLIYVAVPTRNEDNTIFRVGEIGAGTITWRPMVTICGVKLVTLATTAQDPQRVYAIGLRKVTTTENNKSVTQWHGAGLYQINPAQVDPNMSAMAIPGFFPAGHLAITLDGIAVATAVDGDVPVTEYTRLVQVRLPSGSTNGLPPIDLGASGSDDLALTVVDGTVSLAYVVVKAGNGKAVTCREVGNGARVDERPTVVQEGSARCGCSALAGWSP